MLTIQALLFVYGRFNRYLDTAAAMFRLLDCQLIQQIFPISVPNHLQILGTYEVEKLLEKLRRAGSLAFAVGHGVQSGRLPGVSLLDPLKLVLIIRTGRD